MRLLVNSYGSAILKKDNHLVVKTKDGVFNVDMQKVDTIIISRGTLISSEAMMLATENSIDIIVTDKLGKVKARVWSPNITNLATIRRRQLEFTFSSKAVEWIKGILMEKIDNQIATLLAFYPEEDKNIQRTFEETIKKVQDYRLKINALKADFVSEVAHTLRGWEGAATKRYFQAITQIIPTQYVKGGRSQHPARDIFNAMLNYAYGILYGKIETSLVRAGIDPYLGILHKENYNRPVLTYDIIEKYRHWADYVVITLLQQEVIDEDSFSVDDEGNYWLEGLGKRILIQSMYDYLDEKIKYQNKTISREDIIKSYCIDLAKMFLRFKSEFDSKEIEKQSKQKKNKNQN